MAKLLNVTAMERSFDALRRKGLSKPALRERTAGMLFTLNQNIQHMEVKGPLPIDEQKVLQAAKGLSCKINNLTKQEAL